MPDSPQVGTPLSTPLKQGIRRNLFNCSDLMGNDAAGNGHNRQNHRSGKTKLCQFFQHVDMVVNVMWFA